MLLADVGLVGYPNAGKSSLLAALTHAQPKIASYPFTTLAPNLGVVEQGQGRFTLADIPGIIEGASQGKGLGLEFLRHIARTRVLLYVLDASDRPVATFQTLRSELSSYDPDLPLRPALIALNKIDLLDGEELTRLEAELAQTGLPVLAVSVLERRGLGSLVEALFALVAAAPKPALATPAPRPEEAQGVQVREVEEGVYEVQAPGLERHLRRLKGDLMEASGYLQDLFKRYGVESALKSKGVRAGDTVRLAGLEFEYIPEV